MFYNSILKRNRSDVANYDIIFITNIPAFYKINLFNGIVKSRKIFIIFLKDQSTHHNEDFYKGDRNFDWISLNRKFIINQIIFVFYLLRRTHYRNLIIDGWDNLLYWLAAFISPRIKNAAIVESSFLESKTNGLKRILKKVFLNRISKSYASGKGQEQLLQKLNFNGKIVITKGVGIFNIVKQPAYYPKEQVKNFIYVGRLSWEKNLQYLVETFNKLPQYNLNIIGYGPLETKLRQIALRNIKFYGAIDNSELTNYYYENDVLVLPSLYEVWGLVVEEALNNGLPVIASEKVGCVSEILLHDYNSIIFSFSEISSLQKAIIKMADVNYYNTLRLNISQIDFEKIAEQQISCYM